ncbi:MAG: putative Adenosylhomocysteine nucleosidase [Symbiobacteriaceae bacterium]|jgi:nucleoside phosphorylase|nr:putative Adenosylhomocysteine nucleosidase [Symbiobacteriaceae bacterium]
MRIVVQVATQSEWASLLGVLKYPSEVQPVLGGEFIRFSQGNAEVIAVRGGVGKVDAAAMAQYAILTWQPDLVVVMGTGGAVDPGLSVLDIVMATHTIIHDIDSGLDGSGDENIRELTTDVEVPVLPPVLPFPVYLGTVLTGDCDVTGRNVERLRARFAGLVADWESGAVARVCKLNNVRCLVLRGVSDTPYTDGQVQLNSYLENTPVIMARLWMLLTELIA